MLRVYADQQANTKIITYIQLKFSKIGTKSNKLLMASGQGSHWLIDRKMSSVYSPPLPDIDLSILF